MKLNIVAGFLLALLLIAGSNSKVAAQCCGRWHRWHAAHAASCCNKDAKEGDAACCAHWHSRAYWRYKYCQEHCKDAKCTHEGDAKACSHSCKEHEDCRDWWYNHRYYNRGAGY